MDVFDINVFSEKIFGGNTSYSDIEYEYLLAINDVWEDVKRTYPKHYIREEIQQHCICHLIIKGIIPPKQMINAVIQHIRRHEEYTIRLTIDNQKKYIRPISLNQEYDVEDNSYDSIEYDNIIQEVKNKDKECGEVLDLYFSGKSLRKIMNIMNYKNHNTVLRIKEKGMRYVQLLLQC